MVKKVLKSIKMLRKSKGYSQTDLAKLMGISQSAYARFERGVTKTYLETVILIAEAFEMSLVDLLAYTDKYVNIKDVLSEALAHEAEVVIQFRSQKPEVLCGFSG
jgi:transcriptional regulator with XRE-family HTH domain